MVSLPLDDGIIANRKFNVKKLAIGGITGVFFIIILFCTNFINYLKIEFTRIDKSLCPIQEPRFPGGSYNNSTILTILNNADFKNSSIEKLAGATKIDTQVYDSLKNVTDDPKFWSKFKTFHKYLEKTFPAVYENTEVQKVNTYGLVFYLKGSNENLKPLMLTAHQDTVPVQSDTLDKWSYPPFEGHYDGEYVFGRGVSDCKNVLIAIMESLELLIKENYKPQRGIVVAFGFDEEISGFYGARSLGIYLENRFGKDSMYAILDEGPGLTVDFLSKRIVAVPGTSEKGWADVRIQLTTPGGHSSIPPDHTSIGFMSELGYILESNPYEPLLTSANPTMDYLKCAAVHGGPEVPKYVKKAIIRSSYDKFANSLVVKKLQENPITRYLIQTAQSMNVIQGGEKSNALPEHVSLLVNHRIAIEKTYESLADSISTKVVKLAKKYDLGVDAFGNTLLEAGKHGKFVVDFPSIILNPAPVTPVNDTVWSYLAGSVRHVFENFVFPDVDYPIITAPALMPANTDTRHYWDLTRNIFRFSPFFSNVTMTENGIHSVDERIQASAHLQLVAFFYQYVQTVDTPDADN
ncbi:uncharacterized protein PRCAT00000582001 [Priceomyces carsonii]|uniref:uncharacterized protein n=1 Tax=Priceomyces carsonii TaxID=28549 RepID=UPI002ED9C1BB|nr:unnamed protein product [Priceomyces carsonii]